MAAAVRQLKRRGGLPCTLTEAGSPGRMWDQLVAESFHPLGAEQPRPMTPEDLRAVYEELL